ncbi:hypothetical protein QWY93_18815 [Echinicola jeungdonensis]|uniref:hypothetical protein n=1 Tax=Echinicola jeungdonensis TaxID=709343 RepID=UPI0025B38916|nr:hypothetical protein [Echinicola jeungdonensis]MDN3671324.1 hypothetical protein [Echinicola jeungdonensis]
MQGVVGELGGMEDERQTVAIAELDFEPQGGNRLFYTFYITPGGQLEYAIMDMNDQGGPLQPTSSRISFSWGHHRPIRRPYYCNKSTRPAKFPHQF